MDTNHKSLFGNNHIIWVFQELSIIRRGGGGVLRKHTVITKTKNKL